MSFFEGASPEFLDHAYFDEAFAGIVAHESELLYLIERYAPKFETGGMPVVNLLPIFIAGYEMLFLTEAIPEKVSINEALEITKLFSDDSARLMVNGVLNSLKE